MISRKGTLLERNMKMIFDLIGFKTRQNIKLAGYEIDVYAVYDGIKIIVECKQYENSNLNVDNLIFQWSGKNKKIKADRVILALYGSKISNKQKKLARDEGIVIWSESDLNKFLDLATEEKEKARVQILDSLNITTEDVKKYREQRERSWQPNYQIYKSIFQDLELHKLALDNLSQFPMHFGGGIFMLKDFSEDRIKSINENSLESIDTIILPDIEIGKEELELAEKYNIKCIVCKDIRTMKIKNGFFSKEEIPEIDRSKTKVLILTIDELKDKFENLPKMKSYHYLTFLFTNSPLIRTSENIVDYLVIHCFL